MYKDCLPSEDHVNAVTDFRDKRHTHSCALSLGHQSANVCERVSEAFEKERKNKRRDATASLPMPHSCCCCFMLINCIDANAKDLHVITSASMEGKRKLLYCWEKERSSVRGKKQGRRVWLLRLLLASKSLASPLVFASRPPARVRRLMLLRRLLLQSS